MVLQSNDSKGILKRLLSKSPKIAPPAETKNLFEAPGKSADAVRSRLVAIGNEWFNLCQNERSKQERQWYLNLSFFYGQQYVMPRTTQGGGFDLYTPRAPYYRSRIVVNQTRKIVRKEISRLTAQKPNAFIVPASTEDADTFAAQAGEQIWDHIWREKKLNKILRESVFWQAVCGNGFIKTYWEPQKLVSKADPNDPNSVDLYGDICIQNITPFHIFVPDLMLTEIEDQPYIMHAQVRNRSWVQSNFGIQASDAKLESVDEGLQNVMGVNRYNTKKDQTIVLEIWVKPGYLSELPEGGMYTIAADQIVQGHEGWPYDHGQYPVAKLDAMPTGKFYNSSIVEDLIPLQRELNRSRSQLIESKNKMSKPQLVAEEGSVDAKMITSEPGQVIKYKMGHPPPTPLPLQNLPSYVTEEINRLYEDMADVSGQHEVSNGSTPPGVTAATAISFLQEQDETLIAGQYSSIEEALEKIASQDLMFVKMYWDEPRTVKVVGIDGSFDAQVFKGADLRGNTDIRVEGGSALPTSRAAKQAFIMDLMKMGYINPDEGLELLEVGGLKSIYERVQIDKRQAQRENLKMRVVTEEDIQMHMEQWKESNPEGQKDIDSGLQLDPPLIIPVHSYDEHEVHIEIHNNYRKSQNFESASDITKALFEEHVRMHQEALIGKLTHPLTGLDPSNPAAPAPEEEEMAMQEMEQESGSPGPVPMPELEGDIPPEGMMQ